MAINVAVRNRPLRQSDTTLPRGGGRKVLNPESRTAQESDLNWNGILAMMALLLVSFGLYGAAMGTYLTLMN